MSEGGSIDPTSLGEPATLELLNLIAGLVSVNLSLLRASRATVNRQDDVARVQHERAVEQLDEVLARLKSIASRFPDA